MSITVYDFEDYLAFLQSVRQNYPGMKGPIRFRRWSNKLGYRSPRSIEMVIQGKRLPSGGMIRALSRDLGFTLPESRYFELLVLKERLKRRSRDHSALDGELSNLRPRAGVGCTVLPGDVFRLIADWYFLAIKQLVASPGFVESPAWIAERLRGKIQPQQATEAIEIMLKVGILTRQSGQLAVSTQAPLMTLDDVPSAAVRRHHSQMMERARDALEEQALSEREILGLTLRVERRRIPELKRVLREFSDRVSTDYGSAGSDAVYQLNLQLFSHTRPS